MTCASELDPWRQGVGWFGVGAVGGAVLQGVGADVLPFAQGRGSRHDLSGALPLGGVSPMGCAGISGCVPGGRLVMPDNPGTRVDRTARQPGRARCVLAAVSPTRCQTVCCPTVQ